MFGESGKLKFEGEGFINPNLSNGKKAKAHFGAFAFYII